MIYATLYQEVFFGNPRGWRVLNVGLCEYDNNGLYSKVSPWLNEIDDHWMSNIYLENINPNLMKTVEHGYTYLLLHKRSIINFIK